MKIASFNVNSVKARLPRLLEWLKNSNPDVVLLQELKCIESEFPFEALYDAGYNSAVAGQKSYNGVAILSKFKIEDVVKALPNIEAEKGEIGYPLLRGSELTRSATMGDSYSDEQARYIEAVISISGKAIRVASIYVPNGGGDLMLNETLENSQKFIYKLKFFERLKSHFSRLAEFNEIQIFGGDYNVAVEEIDVFDAKSLRGTVCFHDLEREKFRSILNLGIVDSYRAANPSAQAFSWWDYRGGSWQHNKGMRIDYLLTSPQAADKIIAATIEDRGVRDQEKASDHCPVCVTIEV
ncbi:MAG: exodeoxyribonuclease III [Proteobacteria bacterium]|nr:exodeoxyribonuclease III [Pseudomonadota bacterium]